MTRMDAIGLRKRSKFGKLKGRVRRNYERETIFLLFPPREESWPAYVAPYNNFGESFIQCSATAEPLPDSRKSRTSCSHTWCRVGISKQAHLFRLRELWEAGL